MNVREIARVAHEANRGIQTAQGDEAISPPWEEAPEWQKASIIAGVEKALEGASPEELHRSWCEKKREDGWIWGPKKDAKLQTHPCLVPYDQLPSEQRLKDYVFAAIVNALGHFATELTETADETELTELSEYGRGYEDGKREADDRQLRMLALQLAVGLTSQGKIPVKEDGMSISFPHPKELADEFLSFLQGEDTTANAV